MKIYQFIKYNQETEIDHIKNYGDSRLTICFDFEDGVQQCFNSEKTSILKEKHRDYFSSIISKFRSDIKIGVRVNSTNPLELEKDILEIKNKNIHSIFIPKVESLDKMGKIVEKLDKNGIAYKEIIPVIESSNGLANIRDIVENESIKNIAFGHCDYNMSLNILPFFHQDNFEYWKWVEKIINSIKDKGICFINSPYLFIKNDDFFISMLQHLKNFSSNNCGQITLSNNQTSLILLDKNREVEFDKLLANRHQLYPTNQYLKKLISDYEKFNRGNGLSKSMERIISVQEYLVAKRFKAKSRELKTKVLFVGGCFPVQHNIIFEDIFLSKTKLLVEKDVNTNLEIDIIRYERFAKVLEKIKNHGKSKDIDILIFSIRPEPFFRLIKFYYKYIDYEGKIRHSLNLPILNIVNPEKYDLLFLSRIFDSYYDYYDYKESSIHNFLVDANYFIGKLFGNKSYAIRKYIELIEEIGKYCNENNIFFILLGPNLRSKTKEEPKFCRELDKKVRDKFPNISYVTGFEEDGKRDKIFQKNGIHVSKFYHSLIAKRLSNVIKNRS
ncbi:MAG: hypothetical protein CSA15_07335 [Candidatus Delongbacteria bacterium]|nr:MAG: hypothetical protein CSA15_07335 [Candidatus Delongbacteria bacterium]